MTSGFCMCTQIQVCSYMHAHVYMYIYTHISRDIHTYIHTYERIQETRSIVMSQLD